MPAAAVEAAAVPPATEAAAGPKASSAAPSAAVEKSKPGIGVNVTGLSVVIREGRAAIARNVVVSGWTLIAVLSRRALTYCQSSDNKSETAEKENGSR
jgi:hypothetical protein